MFAQDLTWMVAPSAPRNGCRRLLNYVPQIITLYKATPLLRAFTAACGWRRAGHRAAAGRAGARVAAGEKSVQ